MTDRSGIKPAGYVQIGLPLGVGDRTAALSEILRDLAVPAVVAYSPLAGGTIANVLAAADKSVLSLITPSDPILRFALVDDTLLRATVGTLIDPGDERPITFGGTTWRVTSPSRHPDDKHESRRRDRLSAPAPRLDGLAWTTRSSDNQLALMAGMDGVALEVATGLGGTRIVSPSRGADLGAILARGMWAMSHGVAIWQARPEFGALIEDDQGRHALTWQTPWTIVDPSRPGQLLADGRPLAEAIRLRWSNEPDLTPWAERFELDFERIERLRVLSTRVPSADLLGELVQILVLPRPMTQLMDPHFDRTQLAGFR